MLSSAAVVMIILTKQNLAHGMVHSRFDIILDFEIQVPLVRLCRGGSIHAIRGPLDYLTKLGGVLAIIMVHFAMAAPSHKFFNYFMHFSLDLIASAQRINIYLNELLRVYVDTFSLGQYLENRNELLQ